MKIRQFSNISAIFCAGIGMLIVATIFITTTKVLAAGRIPGIDSSSKYLQYYGIDYSTANLNLMATFDVVVLNPTKPTVTPAVVAYLKNNGVSCVLGYISIGEDQSATPIMYGDGKGPVYYDNGIIVEQNMGVASFYVDQEWDGTQYVSDGLVDYNMTFGGRFVIPNAGWRYILDEQRIGGAPGLPERNLAGLQQIVGTRESDTDTNRGNNFGFDGFFLDTLDTAGPFQNVWGYYAWTAEEMRNTAKFIHDTYPGKIIFANRGVFFYHPSLVNNTFNIRPYDFTIRPYIHAGLFESYTLDSSTAHTGVSPYAGDNKHNYAQKIMAEANRPDGFTVFCLDYQMDRGAELYAYAQAESAIENGWVEYIAVDRYIDTIGTYMSNNPLPTDTAPPVWDSTGSPSYSPADVPDRVGIQSLQAGQNSGEAVLHWDIARDQSIPVKYNIYQSFTSDFSSYEVYSNVTYEVGNGWAFDPTVGFANKYTVTGLAAGIYYFRVRAQDSSFLALEDDNTVTLSVTVNGVISNLVENITVDGNLVDWADITSFGLDPDDTSGENELIDWSMAWLANDGANIYLAYRNNGAITLNWGFSLYLDTDINRITGYRGAGNDFLLGAEYLIQGNFVYRYVGNGTSWNWDTVGLMTWSVSGNNAEFSFPQALIGSPERINLFLYGENSAFGGTTLDYYPDNAANADGGTFSYRVENISNSGVGMVIDGDLSDWVSLMSFGLDPVDAQGDNDYLDWRNAWFADDANNFYLAYKNESSITLSGAYNLYLDTDINRTTGFCGSYNNFPLGAEYLVQGATIYQYTGNGVSWNWVYAGVMMSSINGNNVEFSFPRSLIGDPNIINLLFYGDNIALGGETQDYYPDNALNFGGGGGCFKYETNNVSESRVGLVEASNSGSGLTVDGDLADWTALMSFGVDPDDVLEGNVQLDWREAWLANDSDNFYIAYTNDGQITLNWAYNMYLDTDGDKVTGYRGANNNYPVGAEYLVQGATIYQYTGNGISWGWVLVNVMTNSVNENYAEFSFPRSMIGNPEIINLFLYGTNSAFGAETTDFYPDNALYIGGSGGDFFTYRLSTD